MTPQLLEPIRSGATEQAATLTRTLGWVSLGLGAAQLTAPHAVARLAGLDDSARAQAVVPAVGVRELVHAAGLIRGRQPSQWIWTRVAGDAMDLVTLRQAMAVRKGERRRRVATATAVVAGITALDVLAAVLATRARRLAGSPLRVVASVTVKCSTEDAYRHWHRLENLPSFMTHLKSVEVLSESRSRWTAAAPAGRAVSWDAELTADKPGELIGWRSLPGSTVPNAGSVRFRPAPGGRGTEVRVELVYYPPAGKLGAAVARMFGENPQQQIRDDLRRFKQVMEVGEIVRSEGSPEGTKASRLLRQRPARPLARDRSAAAANERRMS